MLGLCVTLFSSCLKGDQAPGGSDDGTGLFKINFIIDGKVHESVESLGNEAITAPAAPVKIGFAFEGWYTDNEYTQAFSSNSFLNTTLTENVNIYAKYSKVNRAAQLNSVSYVGLITGEDSINKTLSSAGVGGTDLGVPLYNSQNDTMYIFFGDTFENGSILEGNWRSNVCFTSTDKDLSDGIEFNGAIVNNKGVAKNIAHSFHRNFFEMTKIPTGAIEIDGVMYMFYFSKYSWDNDPRDSMNYGGCVKSSDSGQTWERVYDLSWVNHTTDPADTNEGLSIPVLSILVNADNSLNLNRGNIDIGTHFGYYFTQISPIDGKDGYIYILGEGGYRTEGIKLGRVLKENFENFEEYEYFNGYNDAGEVIWLKGSEGCKTVCDNPEAFIINDICGEHSVMYNEYLGKWVVTYLSTEGLVLRVSDNIWGNYGEEIIVMAYWDVETICPEGYRLTSIYGSFVHEKWTEGNGKTMYMVFSQYTPLYNSTLLKIEWE